MEKKYIILGKGTPEGDKIDKIICELEGEDVGKFKFLGKAIGLNIGHCLHLGLTHKENFWGRVIAYRIFQNEETKIWSKATGKEYIAVEFFEKPD